MIKITETGATVVTGDHIRLMQMIALKKAIVLEGHGLKVSSGPSAMSIAKKRYGLKGNREKIIAGMQTMIDAFVPYDEGNEQ